MSFLLLAPWLSACTAERTPDRVEDSTGCIWRSESSGNDGPVSVYGRALAGEGTLYVNPKPGLRSGNDYTVFWESGLSEQVVVDDSGRIPLSLSGLEAGEQRAQLQDQRGNEAVVVSLYLVAPGEPAVICAGAVLEDGSAQEPQPFDDPMIVRAWTQEAQGLELLLWIYEYDQGLFTDTVQTVARHTEVLEQDEITASLQTTYPTDEGEFGGLELGGVARLLDQDGEQVGEDAGFPVFFSW